MSCHWLCLQAEILVRGADSAKKSIENDMHVTYNLNQMDLDTLESTLLLQREAVIPVRD